MRSQERPFHGAHQALLCLCAMSIEELLVILGCFLCCVERWKEIRGLYHAVREPLVQFSEEQCVSKVIVAVLIAGGAATCIDRGRTALQQRRQKREFNSTKGFPGEDIQN